MWQSKCNPNQIVLEQRVSLAWNQLTVLLVRGDAGLHEAHCRGSEQVCQTANVLFADCDIWMPTIPD
jgi:hypothetical protein